MTLDRDALLKLADEADKQRNPEWTARVFCAESMDIDKAASEWAADAHEREGLLTAGLREALDAVMLLKLDEEGLRKRDDLRLRNMRLQEQRITALEQLAEERERVAEWLSNHQFATGHGDTISDLLDAWEQQLTEARAEIERLGALLDQEKAGSRHLSENAHHFAEQLAEARTRIGELEAGK